jgi:predicted transcriptional regulator
MPTPSSGRPARRVRSDVATAPSGTPADTTPAETVWPETDWPEPAVRLRDARSLRAFAHPLRVKLMSALRSYGPLTATQAAEYVGDSPSNCSFHLRTLGSFGVIEQVPGSDNRSRPWRAVRGSVSFDPDDSAESRAAWEAASDVLHATSMDELAAWIRVQPDQRPPWHDGWFDSSVTAPMTAEELGRLGKQISALLQPFVDRKHSRADRGEPLLQSGELPARVLAIGFPNTLPRPEEPPVEHDPVEAP